MIALHSAYESDWGKIHCLPRKTALDSPKTVLTGPPHSGKTTLIRDTLARYGKKERLYLDLADFRIDSQEIAAHLVTFCAQKNIQALAIEHYDSIIPLPANLSTLIVSSDSPQSTPQGFESVTLQPLDFEEYLLFERKQHEVQQSFDAFLKDGTLPEISALPEFEKAPFKQALLEQIAPQESQQALLQQLILASGNPISLHQQYQRLKTRTKISKDRVYEFCAELELQQIIHWIPKYRQPKAPKKLFLYDFSLKNALTYEKNFLATLGNMVFWELRGSDEEVVYADWADFYLPESGIGFLIMPFANQDAVEAKMTALVTGDNLPNLDILHLITLGHESSGQIGKLRYEAIPFWMWAVAQ